MCPDSSQRVRNFPVALGLTLTLTSGWLAACADDRAHTDAPAVRASAPPTVQAHGRQPAMTWKRAKLREPVEHGRYVHRDQQGNISHSCSGEHLEQEATQK